MLASHIQGAAENCAGVINILTFSLGRHIHTI